MRMSKHNAFWAGVLLALPAFAQLQPITINYPAKAPANWPLFLAKEGGYYQKYGLDVDLKFVVHPGKVTAESAGNHLSGRPLLPRQANYQCNGNQKRGP